MRQVGVIAAPCMVALDTMVDRLADDHRRTRQIAQGLNFSHKLAKNFTNLIFFQEFTI